MSLTHALRRWKSWLASASQPAEVWTPCLYLDGPTDRCLRQPIEMLEGFCVVSDPAAPLQLSLDRTALSSDAVPRPDLKRIPWRTIGFRALVDTADFPGSTPDGSLALEACSGAETFSVSLKREDGLAARADQARQAKAERLAWLLDRLRCPSCGHDGLQVRDSDMSCSGCAAVYPRTPRMLDLLTGADRQAFRLSDPPAPSAHVYSADILSFIDAHANQPGAYVLDCGAGLRKTPHPRVVTTDIAPYPSTDVICAGQKLPFADNTFAAALSIAVLEHVTDPFACAAELRRVVRPGGAILCVAPFLVPEHDVPQHYYNMTRAGLRNLFAADDMVVERHSLEPYNHPIYSLTWILSEYVQGLSPAARQRLSQLKVADLLAKSWLDWLKDPIATELQEEASWRIAASTTLVCRKTGQHARRPR
jgi:SAM-dependent methyltransferase